MARLLSGSTLRTGGSGEFIDLAGAMPQLPPTDTTATGFTIATDDIYRTTYRSSLGFIEMTSASMYSALPEGAIRVLSTGAAFLSTSSDSGNFIVEGGVGIGGNMYVAEDIVVNGITIGRGYEGQNNIVVRGDAEVPLNDFTNGQECIAIGYDTLTHIETGNRVIAIGYQAVSTGTNLRGVIAIGDNTLKELGVLNNYPVGDIVTATNTNPVVIEVTAHGLDTGTKIFIDGVVGMSEINQSYYFIDWLSTNTFALYNDNILSSSTNGISYGAYVSGGAVGRVLLRDNNIAIGNNAGRNLIDGEKNYFIGDQAAKNFNTGSNNFFVGSDVGINMTRANGTIAIGSDNLVDGQDNQVAIGSVFYYNGVGFANINADTEIGTGTESTSSDSGGLTVRGGAGIGQNLFVGGSLNALTTANFYGELLPVGSVNIGSADAPFNSLYLNGTTLYLSTVTLKSADELSFSIESSAGYVRQTVGNLTLDSNLASTNYNNGSLVVQGGSGFQGDVYVGGSFNVVGTEAVNLTPAGSDVNIQPTLGGSILIQPETGAAGNIDNMIVGENVPANGTFIDLIGTSLEISSTATSTSTTTGAVVVGGGVGIRGNVYAESGNPDENYMLYTPRSTISTSAPADARIGDFWINPNGPYFFQYINDDGNRIWVQIR